MPQFKGSLIIWIQRTLNQKNLKLKEWNLQYCRDQFFFFSLALYWFCMKIFTKFSFSLSLSLSLSPLTNCCCLHDFSSLLTLMVIGCFLLPPKPSPLQNSLTSGVVLEDFDSIFSNKFYHSHLDDMCELVFLFLDASLLP
jgi:hypothetical protein